jgi:predicted metalloprotease with PDZ domain
MYPNKNAFKTLLTLFFFAFSLLSTGQSIPSLKYELRMPEPETHFFEVKMSINKVLSNSKLLDKDHVLVKMPVWTPGSYLIREYAGNVEAFIANSENGKTLKSRKINKNTWEIEIDRAEDIHINYKVYANTLTVRTSFIDASHGYLNGASIFMFVPQLMDSPSELTVFPYEKWSTISTALPEIRKNTFAVKDFDALVDSPIEIGNHEVLEFEALSIPHKIAMYSSSPLSYDKEKLLSDYKKMVIATTSIVGENPLDHYLFIVHHQPGIGGGLEHLFSTTCQTSTYAYSSESNYKGFFGLLAHEYFHLWNVKRIRPVALGPFDYENENYTRMLWVAEGFTNFFEEVILKRAGIYTEEDVLKNHSNALGASENSTGAKVQAVTESSWDAWIKYYRPHENSANTTISYYVKGGMLATLLNAKIIANTNGEKSLENVMQLLYTRYYKELGRGYTDQEFQEACEEIHGSDLDYFFENYVSDTKTPDFKQIYNSVGINLIMDNEKNTPYLGITERGGAIYRISSDGTAYHSGLSVGDEVISIDGNRDINFANALLKKEVGQKMNVTIRRFGVFHDFELELIKDPKKSYQLQKMEKLTPIKEKFYRKFLGE